MRPSIDTFAKAAAPSPDPSPSPSPSGVAEIAGSEGVLDVLVGAVLDHLDLVVSGIAVVVTLATLNYSRRSARAAEASATAAEGTLAAASKQADSAADQAMISMKKFDRAIEKDQERLDQAPVERASRLYLWLAHTEANVDRKRVNDRQTEVSTPDLLVIDNAMGSSVINLKIACKKHDATNVVHSTIRYVPPGLWCVEFKSALTPGDFLGFLKGLPADSTPRPSQSTKTTLDYWTYVDGDGTEWRNNNKPGAPTRVGTQSK